MAATDANANAEIAQRLMALVEPIVRSEGLVLVELQWRSENIGQVLRLFVDRPEGGVTLDECSLISRQVSDLLDVEDPIGGAYRLEVSSPGLDRRLKSAREYAIFAGRLAKLVINDDGENSGRLVVRGRLMGLQGDDVLLEIDGRPKAVPLGQVVKANLIVE